ncbi:hypothetical protein GHT06_009892 [Daphnia sinensis]|uniref:HAT C-terminal dimerisation domain-containing protein n=1 Tax=Daphnia sinensis TaxID=1820382 RepID=A0AAD5KXA7_9CRUS|nr:hypothetical protein GHT06_009892 [Daphnia sinensis]
MLADLSKRFDFTTEEDDPDFDCIYLLATCLDCNYRIFVIEDLGVQKLVLKNIVKIAKQLGLQYSVKKTKATILMPIVSTPNRDTDGYENLNVTSFRLLLEKEKASSSRATNSNDHVRSSSSMSGRSTTDLNSDNDQLTNIELELLDYFNFASRSLELPTTTTMQDAIEYWKDIGERFPFLKSLAYSILAIPVSSAAAEREFSVSGWHTLGRKNRTTGVTLAAKVFLTCNKDLLRSLLL